jgi:hypothetical protein
LRRQFKSYKGQICQMKLLLNFGCFFANNHKGNWFLLNPFYMGACNSKLTTSLTYYLC